MRDEMFDRDYQIGRDGLNHGIDTLGRSIMAAFETLTANQFKAPWKVQPKRNQTHCG